MKRDAFSLQHPAVNFAFYLAAIVFAVTIQHPAYILAGFLFSLLYNCLLNGKTALKMLLLLAPLFCILTAMNPLFNHQGSIVLCTVFGKPYTLEALEYGAVLSSLLLIMLQWFSSYNTVMTSDKFISLFGSKIPSLSLLLVMVLRMVPTLLRKAAQISGARKCIGQGVSGDAPRRDRLNAGLQVLSALSDWAFEGSIVTADSMRSRGYGTKQRSSFQIYHLHSGDILLSAVMGILLLFIVSTVFTGGSTASFTPNYYVAPITGFHSIGYAAYCLFLSIPSFLHLTEDILWTIYQSRI